jgi:hypothetical protein
LHPGDDEPAEVESLKQEERGTRVDRIVPLGSGPAVIAKRCARETARVECQVYERVLPRIGVRAPRFYGSVTEPSGDYCWLFLGEVSGSAYRSHSSADRVAAAGWLGRLHGAASLDEEARQLPDRSPDHYRDVLASVDEVLRARLGDRAAGSRRHLLLEATLRHCERLRRDWSVLEGLCDDGPPTLVHGDFVAHNAFVRTDGSGTSVMVIDWEKAGWGTPAEDISSVDLPAYLQAVRDYRPSTGLETLQRLALAGRFFRCLVFLDWVVPRIDRERGEAALQDLERCDGWLAALTEKL